MSLSAKKRILFVTENVTLAQVVRSVVLARSLDPSRWEVHFAAASFDPLVFAGTSFVQHPIFSLPKADVDAAIASGKRIYELDVLTRYVAEERALLERIRPDLVVGDLRFSLHTSAELTGVPYANLIDAFWSPHAVRERFPLPEHPIVRMVGVEKAERYFPMALPQVFSHFAKPVNQLRKRHKLAEVGSLLPMITAGDYTLFPETPSLVPMSGSPSHHVFIGPVLWAPAITPPPFWASVPDDRPLVYVTMGSSGQVDVLPRVLEGLAALQATVVVSTAGRYPMSRLPKNVLAADMLPGDVMARRADVVVCNGGASTAYQALAEGKPVVGIPYNLDQYLAMTAIAHSGAGVLLRAGTLTAAGVREATARALTDAPLRAAAKRVATDLARYRAADLFPAFVERACAGRRAA